MTLSHRSVVRRFTNGETSGKSSSLSISDLGDGYTALVGYGHAAYAVRLPNGTTVRFDGWAFQQCRPRQHSGSATTKSNHWPAMARVGDIRVAYEHDSTGMEAALKSGADHVTDDEYLAAPSIRHVPDAAKKAYGICTSDDGPTIQ